MQLETATTENPQDWEADVLAIGIFEDQGLSETAARLDGTFLGGLVQRLFERGDVSGKRFKVTPLLGVGGLRAEQLVAVGLGRRKEWDRTAAFRAAGALARALGERQRGKVILYLDAQLPHELVQSAVAGACVGSVGQDLYRAETNRYPLQHLVIPGAEDSDLAAGQIWGDAINLARRLVNEPPSVMTPIQFAAEAESVAQRCGLEIEVWDDRKLADERCGAMLAVARGSAAPPRLVILQYHGTGAGDSIGLVGKGVTFDSGGLSLKPTDGMKTMKCDMAGAATVLATMQAIAQLQLPIHVIGLMGLVENMPGHESYRLGDVLTARNGKTIEVHNTDAEGRLVLADVLSVAVDRGAARLVDVATLTGACVVALGNDVIGAMTNEQSWCDQLIHAASRAGERAWQLPMFPEFAEQIKSEVADIKNVGNGRWGGAITAAKFLEEFVAGRPWIHLDIAGPAFQERPKAWIDAGASGAGVATLVEMLANVK